MNRFISVRTKLTLNTMITISVIFIIVLSSVTVINIRSVNQNMLKSERNIRNSLTVRGNTLINNNSMAMKGMAEDNAFTAIRNLVSSAVKDDPDIIYGIYMNQKHITWAYSTPANPSGEPQNYAPLSDEISQWAGSLKKPDHRIYIHQGKEIIEFAAPVFVEEQIAGFIRYGISTESMRKLLQEAFADGIRARNYTIAVLLCLGTGSLLVSYFIVRRLSSKITAPIDSLVKSAMTIASGNYDVPVISDSNDELGLLVKDVDKMRISIRELTENLKEQERLKNEMELARRIQTSLLPILAEKFHPDFEIAAAMLPADQVGGDFYDISYDGKGNLWFAIGDVSGHGVTPGLIMMMAQTIHTTVTASMDCDARGVVITINKILYRNVHGRLNENHFMTFTALKYLGNGLFQHAGAHLSMILFRQKTGTCELIKTRGVYLNFKENISKGTQNGDFCLECGDILVLYTDGLTEANNPEGKMLDIGGLMNIVKKHACREPEEMKEMIMADVIQWCDNKRADDMSIVIIKRKK